MKSIDRRPQTSPSLVATTPCPTCDRQELRVALLVNPVEGSSVQALFCEVCGTTFEPGEPPTEPREDFRSCYYISSGQLVA